jgi:putative DNA primase/helicase
MRQDFFEFRPQFKLVVIGNHKPALRNVDDAARHRFNVVPFVHKPPVPDRELETKLCEEWPAILRWMINGCLTWQRGGLVRPQVVLEATAEYFSEQDSVQQWIDECCETGGRDVFDTVANLFRSWTAYATTNGEKPGNSKWLAQTLRRQGCESVPHTPGHHEKRGFLGISVKNVDTSGQWQNRTADHDAPPL